MEKIMDSARDFDINVRRQVSFTETAAAVAAETAEALKCFFEFLLYITEYAISEAYRAIRSEKAAYLLGRYKKAVLGGAAFVAVFAAIGIAGGVEAGLVSAAIGVPVFIALCVAFRFLSRD